MSLSESIEMKQGIWDASAKGSEGGVGFFMTAVRQDAWSPDDDLILAEVTLRHIREGGTQLKAFEEVGERIGRTPAACGFRWNSCVRKRYEEAIRLAKAERQKTEQESGRTGSRPRGRTREEGVLRAGYGSVHRQGHPVPAAVEKRTGRHQTAAEAARKGAEGPAGGAGRAPERERIAEKPDRKRKKATTRS